MLAAPGRPLALGDVVGFEAVSEESASVSCHGVFLTVEDTSAVIAVKWEAAIASGRLQLQLQVGVSVELGYVRVLSASFGGAERPYRAGVRRWCATREESVGQVLEQRCRGESSAC